MGPTVKFQDPAVELLMVMPVASLSKLIAVAPDALQTFMRTRDRSVSAAESANWIAGNVSPRVIAVRSYLRGERLRDIMMML